MKTAIQLTGTFSIVLLLSVESYCQPGNRFGQWKVQHTAWHELSWAPFLWASDTLGGRFFDRTAMLVPVRVEGLPYEFLFLVAESSCKFINDNHLSPGRFAWQDSASAFSVSKSDVDKVCKYIRHQPEHHRKRTFAEEYEEFLRHFQQTLKWEITE